MDQDRICLPLQRKHPEDLRFTAAASLPLSCNNITRAHHKPITNGETNNLLEKISQRECFISDNTAVYIVEYIYIYCIYYIYTCIYIYSMYAYMHICLYTGWAKSICSTLKAYNLGSLAVRCILNASN